MKKAKKVVALALCAVMLVVGSVAGTMAYLTSTTDVVTNTFTVGKVAITLDEAKVDVYGVEVEGADRVLGNEYKLMPGHTYVKDPTVTVTAGSEESYVRMIVTISDLADLKAACGVDVFLPEDFVNGWDSEVWNCVSAKETNDTGIYEFWYNGKVNTLDGEDLELDALFDSFTMPDDATNDQIAELEEVEVNVIAHAIQADGFEDAAEAWGTWE